MALFGFLHLPSRHEKAAKDYDATVAAINALSSEMKGLSDEALKERLTPLKGKSWEDLESHAAEIFAAVREAADRTLKMRHFDVQLTGGLALLDGKIAEMKTGEGKTLVATLPLTYAALTGKGAHLVTVNDYLARRDALWMKPVYEFFGLTVGVVVPGQSYEEKRAAYAADVTYGTNNEYGFDYLRDNMAQRAEDLVQRDLHYAIVDEVDSILIDEARTPLIISAPDAESTQLYVQFAGMVPQLTENTHYNLDEKRRAATLTDEGVNAIEKMLGIENIYEEKGVRFVHHLEQALRASTLYKRDKDYVVQDGQVKIVDEFTGRILEGRRYSEGLHQALEAKERVAVQQESRTLATITFQNFFRLYGRLGGMTGTAVTSAEEFERVYNLDVVVVPTNKQMIRNDKADKVFVNEPAKFQAVVKEIKERHAKGQPVLVGTIAIEKSEKLSTYLTREGIPHEVLNAKHHAREAEIVAKAGQKSNVTISTNMAGRGTDIKLGDGVVELGGLFILGTERHEARRIDNQLRGRSGRQGDPGETQFFVSLDDDVMRIFGGDRIKNLMTRLSVPEDEPIENRLVSRAIESAQERVEGYYFDMRKHVLQYDDVLNRQRNAIYTLRRSVLRQRQWRDFGKDAKDLNQAIRDVIQDQAHEFVNVHTGEGHPEDWDLEELREIVFSLTGKRETFSIEASDGPESAREKLTGAVATSLLTRLDEREQQFGSDTMRALERAATLRAIDTYWMEHLDTMDYLRTGIGLRGYGQRDPLVEYQREGHQLFQRLLATIKGTIVDIVFKAEPTLAQREATQDKPQGAVARHQEVTMHQTASGKPNNPISAPGAETSGGSLKNPYKKIGRNDPCPCGSGLKYKKCGLINSPKHRTSL